MNVTKLTSIIFCPDKKIAVKWCALRSGVVLLALSGCLLARAQTPSSALNKYRDGSSKLEKGELDEAIRDYTAAIELSANLVPANTSKSQFGNNRVAGSDSSILTVIDPFYCKCLYKPRCSALSQRRLRGGAP